jgi:folate-binding protein YgfZ
MAARSLIVAAGHGKSEMTVSALIAKQRGILEVGGEDRVPFLQGLVTNDVTKAAAGHAVYAALLTAQGRFLHDFFIVPQADALLIDCEAERRADLIRRLTMYKLRAKVTLEDRTASLTAILLWGDSVLAALSLPPDPGAIQHEENHPILMFVDPRLPSLGARAIVPAARADEWMTRHGFSVAGGDDYDRHRIAHGVPDGSRDLPVEKALLLENGFDELHGIDWDKGCYIGQEVTARMRYRSLVRKKLLPVTIAGPVPGFGTTITVAGAEAGEMRSAVPGLGLALLREEALNNVGEGLELTAADATLRPLRAN